MDRDAAQALGLAPGHVALAWDHETWSSEFERERSRILAAIGEHVIEVEHIGSTSVPGVPAKPILDVLVGVEDFEQARVCVAPLRGLGYSYRGEYGIARRHYFVRGEPRTHHVHMVEVQSDQWRSTLKFRDLLRARSKIAREYAEEKLRLVRRYSHDRASYKREKDAVIETILSRP